MDTSIALATQTIVLPEADSPKMLGRESRSLESKSFCLLLTCPSEIGEPWRIRLLLWAVQLWTLHPLLEWKASVPQSSTASWDITEWGSPCQQPRCSPPFLSRGAAWRWDNEVYICNWRELPTLEFLLFCQEPLKALCAGCGNQSCSSGAIRCILWVLLAARLTSSITLYMMPLLPSYQAKFWGRRLCEMHQKILFLS